MRSTSTEMRIARLGSTLGFFFAVVMVMIEHGGTWYYVTGALLFGAMSAYLWAPDRQAQADLKVNEEMDRKRQAREQSGQGGGWS